MTTEQQRHAKTYTYEEARREVRKLLRTDKAEVKELPEPKEKNIAGFMPFRFLVGMGRGKNFVALAAGMNWTEAIEDLRKQIEKAKEKDGHGEAKK